MKDSTEIKQIMYWNEKNLPFVFRAELLYLAGQPNNKMIMWLQAQKTIFSSLQTQQKTAKRASPFLLTLSNNRNVIFNWTKVSICGHQRDFYYSKHANLLRHFFVTHFTSQTWSRVKEKTQTSFYILQLNFRSFYSCCT